MRLGSQQLQTCVNDIYLRESFETGKGRLAYANENR